MQTLNSTLQYSETALAQRGAAEVQQRAQMPLKEFRFPNATPQRDRVRRARPNIPRSDRTADALRERHIDSAKANAFDKFVATNKAQRNLTVQEIQVRTQWLLRAGAILQSKRNQKIEEPAKGMLSSTLRLFTGSESAARLLSPRLTHRELIQRESEIGGHLFGSIPENHHRQFFNLEPAVWIWYEETIEGKEVTDATTTRYEVHENGILKIQDKSPYYYIEGQEFLNFFAAGEMYYTNVCKKIYDLDPLTGKPLAV